MKKMRLRNHFLNCKFDLEELYLISSEIFTPALMKMNNLLLSKSCKKQKVVSNNKFWKSDLAIFSKKVKLKKILWLKTVKSYVKMLKLLNCLKITLIKRNPNINHEPFHKDSFLHQFTN